MLPAAYIALLIAVAAGCDNGSVRFYTNGVIRACCNGNDIFPVGYITLTMPVESDSDNRSVRVKTDRMVFSCGNGDDVFPALLSAQP